MGGGGVEGAGQGGGQGGDGGGHQRAVWEQQGRAGFLGSLKNQTIGLIWLVTRRGWGGGVGGVGQGGGQAGGDGGVGVRRGALVPALKSSVGPYLTLAGDERGVGERRGGGGPGRRARGRWFHLLAP